MGLIAVGLVALYSYTTGPANEYLLDSVKQNFNRQMLWGIICLFGIGFTLLLPVRFFQSMAYPLYFVMLGLLVMALIFGHEVNGARSWLRIGPAQFQVSELAKVTTLMAIAQFHATRRPGENPTRSRLYAILIILAPVLLILLQNDTGTALIYLGIIPFVLYWMGMSTLYALIMIVPALTAYLTLVYWPAALGATVLTLLIVFWMKGSRTALGMALVTNLGVIALIRFAIDAILKPHHVARLLSFTNPEAIEYRYTIGFHLVQSKAAIGSGEFWGKGFQQGTQTQGAYVPEQTTDFVFSIIGEEFGFMGAIIVLLLFGYLLIRLLILASNIKHPFGSTMAAGAVAIFLIHIILNIGMVTGMLPVIGVPLPFISYGGSALLAASALIAIALNLYMRREDFSIYGF